LGSFKYIKGLDTYIVRYTFRSPFLKKIDCRFIYGVFITLGIHQAIEQEHLTR